MSSYREPRPTLQRVNSQPVMLVDMEATTSPTLPPRPTGGTQSRRLPPQRVPVKPINPNMQSLRGSMDSPSPPSPSIIGPNTARNTIAIPKDVKLQQPPPKSLPPLPPKPPVAAAAAPPLPPKPRDSNTVMVNTYLNSQPLIVPARKLPAAPSVATQPVFSKVAQRVNSVDRTEDFSLSKSSENDAQEEIANSNDRIFASPERLNEIKSRISLAVENNVAMTLAKYARPTGPTQEDLDLLNYTGEEDQTPSQPLPSPPTSPVLERSASEDEAGGRQRSSTNPSKSIRFRKKSTPQVQPKKPERTNSSAEMVVMGTWEKQNSNSLVKQLQKEQQKMEKEKVEITNKSKTQESENVRLSKWRKLLEKIQEEDMAEIRKLEETVAHASREKEYYENSCKIIEKQCSDLLELLQDAVQDLKFNINSKK